MDARRAGDAGCGRISRKCRRIRRAEQLPDPHIGKEGFLDLFGRPSRESSCECERRSDFSLPQALNLVNGRDDLRRGGRSERARREGGAGRASRTGDLVEELYLAALSRSPTAAEIGPGRRSIWRRAAGARRARRICCGRCSTARDFSTTTDGGRRHARTFQDINATPAKDPRGASCCAPVRSDCWD